MKRFKGYLLLFLSLTLYLVAGAALFTMLRALGVQDTLSAVESAFGALVIGIFLLVLARRSFLAGRSLLRDTRESAGE